MNKFIPTYRPFGQPATAWVKFSDQILPTVGKKITIAGTDYVMGTDFLGTTPLKCALSLAAAINAVPGSEDLTPSTKVLVPFKAYYALYYGTHLVLVATNPRVAGSTLSLTTDANVTLSGATFTGGADAIDLVP